MLPSLSFTPVAFTTAGDAADGLIFGWEIATVQKWALIYLGASLLAFVMTGVSYSERTTSVSLANRMLSPLIQTLNGNNILIDKYHYA